MQTIKGYLDRIKEFLEQNMEENNIKLPQQADQGEQEEEVQPLVLIGNLPHANFTTYGSEGRYLKAPFILLGVEDCTFDYDEESIPILIQVCCYAAEKYINTDDPTMKDQEVPDNMGTLDVLNLLENFREWLIINASFPVERPIRLGSYDTKEATYPFSYGYISFNITTYEGKTHKVELN